MYFLLPLKLCIEFSLINSIDIYCHCCFWFIIRIYVALILFFLGNANKFSFCLLLYDLIEKKNDGLINFCFGSETM